MKNWRKDWQQEKKLSWGEIPVRNLSERYTITITIFDRDNSITNLGKCTGGYKLHKSKEKISNLMDMDNIELFVWELFIADFLSSSW